jgi:hypothetical protein
VFGYKLQISSDADFGIPLDYLALVRGCVALFWRFLVLVSRALEAV